MEKNIQKHSGKVLHPVIRVLAGFTALFMLLISIDKANELFGFIITITSLFVLLASIFSFIKGKISKFFGSCFGVMIGIISIHYLCTTSYDIWQGAPIQSIVDPILFTCTFGLFGVFYALETQFGFAEDKPLSDNISWYKVYFDDNHIYRDVIPPDYRSWRKGWKKISQEPWKDKISWVDIDQIFFVATDLYDSDEILFQMRDNDKHFLSIPVEAIGGNELWLEILNRKLFDEKLALEAMTSTGGIFPYH